MQLVKSGSMRGHEFWALLAVGLVLGGCHSSNATVRSTSPAKDSSTTAAIVKKADAAPESKKSADDAAPAPNAESAAPPIVVQTVSAASTPSRWSRLLGTGNPPQRVSLPRNDSRAENRKSEGGDSDDNSDGDF
jgi:hypothetical protein